MPAALLDISNFTPLGAAVQAMHAAYQGSFPSAGPLLVLAGYSAIFSYLAVRFFRWESASGGQLAYASTLGTALLVGQIVMHCVHVIGHQRPAGFRNYAGTGAATGDRHQQI